MKKIILSNILPNVFAPFEEQSEVWQQNKEFVCGEYYLILSDSGKGKSSLFSFIYGHRDDFINDIFFDQQTTKDLSDKEWNVLRKNSLSILFQDLRIFPELTVIENIELKNRLKGYKSISEIMQMLEILEIANKKDVRCEKLSWGQQQRVAIVRCLCQPFDFLLLDEPISHIDDRMAKIVANLVIDEVKKQNAGLIVSSIGKNLPIEYNKILKL